MCFASLGKSDPSFSPPITSVFTLIFAQSYTTGSRYSIC